MTTTAARSLPQLACPRKLNLFLHCPLVNAPDGKHLLESIFILINLFDTIDLIERFDGQLERTGDIIGAPEKDLCIRAAKALLTAAVDHGKTLLRATPRRHHSRSKAHSCRRRDGRRKFGRRHNPYRSQSSLETGIRP